MKIAILPGDYTGPEVMEVAMTLLKQLQQRYSLDIQCTFADVGGIALDKHGTALPDETVSICANSDAILFGAVGGPKWESLPPAQQPERAALLPLRKRFNLFANIRPTIVLPALRHSSPIKWKEGDDSNAGIDFLIIRELTGGVYFSEPKALKAEWAIDTMRYQRSEIERIAHVAFRAAQERRRVVTSIDKANVLSTMVLWRNVVSELAAQYPDVTLEHLYVDNAAMQLIINPQRFDVILCPNMFGDILSDEAAVLPGSIGMQPSASLGAKSQDDDSAPGGYRFGLYEPAGGSAPDIAGKGIANPIAQILSVAMMFRYSFARPDIADTLQTAVRRALIDGARTADIAGANDVAIGTTEMGQRIADML